VEAGANVLVAGSAVFEGKDGNSKDGIAAAIRALLESASRQKQ